MENIATKLELLNCPKKVYPIAYKHIASLNMVSTEELEAILAFLMEKGVIVPDAGKILLAPKNFSILANGSEKIEKIVSDYETIGELDALKEDIIRINHKSAISRLLFLKNNNVSYKNKDGKYIDLPFSTSSFNNYFEQMKEEIKPLEKEIDYEEVTPALSEEVKVESEVNDPLYKILASPQTIGLNNETYERYERLANSTKKILSIFYGINEMSDSIADNLIKLITNNILDDSIVIFYSLTYGKNISTEEALELRDFIEEELEYTNIMDLNIGRSA